MAVNLHPYPGRAPSVVRAVTVSATRPRPATLRLLYKLTFGEGDLALPEPVTPAFADELWKTTCCEAFIRPAGGEAYVEVNLSPSTQWAAYRFTGYREGVTPLRELTTPGIVLKFPRSAVELLADVELSSVPGLEDTDWEVALSVVAADEDGAAAYWALAHPGAKPDFHHPASFTLRLGREPA
jgi:hypothetical protein